MKLAICILAVLCLYVCAAGQGMPVPELKIGDRVPDMLFKNVLQYKSKTARLSDFKRKLILINFWATNCAACAREIPVLDSLQKMHLGELSVLLVSTSKGDDPAKVSKVMQLIRNRTAVTVQLPVILGDTILTRLFPRPYVPHYAWLDSDLKVLAITDGDEATPARIDSVLRGYHVHFLNAPYMADFKKDRPLFTQGNGGDGEQLFYRSSFSGAIPGLRSGTFITRDTNGRVTQVIAANVTLLELLKRAYQYFNFPARIEWPEMPARQPVYTYELICPPASFDSAMLAMQADVKRVLHYSAEIKKTATASYILTVDTSVLNRFRSSGGETVNQLADKGKRRMHNLTLFSLVEFLERELPLPVIDESFYKGGVDLDLSGMVLVDIASVRRVLSSYGIFLTEAERPVEHFFIYYSPN